MKFVLTYDGPLPPSANKSKTKAVWEIRKQFHPQLVDLWSSHPALQALNKNSWFPKTGGVLLQAHHSHDGALISPFETKRELVGKQDIINLNEVIDKHGHRFWPLVRESYALHCGLRVLFLRKEPPGRVYQGGDIDGRIKTLLDALAMPQHLGQVLLDPQAMNPMLCLLEDDSLISGLEVDSERLLTDKPYPKDHVRLVIQVDVRVRLATIYNQSFLG